MGIFSIKPGEEIDSSDDNKPLDAIVTSLFDEMVDRLPLMLEHHAYMEGAPLGNEFQPEEDGQFNGLEQLRDMSRNNYARLVVTAATNKCSVQGFRTAAANDEYGDEKVAEFFDRDDMAYAIQDSIELAGGYRRSYLYVDPLTKQQKIIPPNNAAVLMDSFDEPAAALVMRRDRALHRDTLIVYVRSVNKLSGKAEGPAQMFIATREHDNSPRLERRGLVLTSSDSEVPFNKRATQQWVWWKEHSLGKRERIPLTVLKNKDGKTEYEDATDTIDRLNHMIFQRVIVATMQAFRQRAVKGDFPTHDKSGRKIDYTELFEAGPARMWQLPAGADIWESTPTEYSGLLEAVKADERALGAQTSTPMNYFSDSVNNSAEGAATQKESYYDRIKDRRMRFGSRLRRHVSILMEYNDEMERSRIEDLEVIWPPIETLSLNERAAAFSSLRGQKLAMKTALREGMQMTPKEIQRAINELLEDAMREAFAQPMGGDTPLKKSSQNSQAKGDDSSTLVKAKTEGRKANDPR